jgi:hypothetical protein
MDSCTSSRSKSIQLPCFYPLNYQKTPIQVLLGFRVNLDAISATVNMQPPTSNAPFNAAANAEATSSALETNSPSNSDDQAMLGTAYAVGSVGAEI